MATKPPRLTVVFAADAIGQLHEIWLWNAEHKTPALADRYGDFLKKSIDRLARDYSKGRAVSTRPDLHYVRIRQTTGGYAHVAVYSIEPNRVIVLHVFHEAQDWERRLSFNGGEDDHS